MSGFFLQRAPLSFWIACTGLWLVVAVIGWAPHIYLSHLVGADGDGSVYSPSVLNEYWSQFDPLVKANVAMNIGLNGDICGRLGVLSDGTCHPNTIQQLLGSVILAIPVAITRNPDAVFYALPLFSGLSAVMVAYLMFHLTKNTIVSVCSALFVVCFTELFRPGYWVFHLVRDGYFDMLYNRTFVENNHDMSPFYRMHTLSVTFPILALAMLWLRARLEEARAGADLALQHNVVVGAAIFGAAFYSYLYFVPALALMAAAVFVELSIRYVIAWRQGHDDARQKIGSFLLCFVLVGVGTLLIALPSLLDTLRLSESADFRERITGNVKREIYGAITQLVVFVGVLVVVFRRNAFTVPIIGLVIAILLVANMHVFTGTTLQPYHITSRVAVPILMIAILAIIWRVPQMLSQNSRVKNVMLVPFVLLAIVSVGSASVWATGYAERNAPSQRLSADQLALIQTVREIVPKSSTVAVADADLNEVLAIHARATLYQPFSGHLPRAVTNDEIKSRLANLLWLLNASDRDIADIVDVWTLNDRVAYYYFQRVYAPVGPIERQVLAESLQQKVAGIAASSANPNGLAPFPDYVVTGGVGAAADVLRSPRSACLQERGAFGDYTLYSVDKMDGGLSPVCRDDMR